MDFPEVPVSNEDHGIAFYSDEVDFALTDPKVYEQWLKQIAINESVPFGELNVVFCSDEKLREINIEYLGHDYFTDIITFHHEDDSVNGELYISIDRVTENASDNGVEMLQELRRVLAHGVLHLCGYGDKTEEEQKTMRQKEEIYLDSYKQSQS